MAAEPSNKLTDWVVENLEGVELGSITSSSTSKAAENDTLPADGLCIADFRILPADSPFEDDGLSEYRPIRLLLGRNGWGTGVHPTTRLCLEWLSNFGTGSIMAVDLRYSPLLHFIWVLQEL